MRAAVPLLLLAAGAGALSKRKAPFKPEQASVISADAAQRLVAEVMDAHSPPRAAAGVQWAKPELGVDCSNFPGTYTGLSGGQPIYDAYQLAWKAGVPNGFTAIYVTPASWSLGVGQISPDNTTVTIELDNNRVKLTGTLSNNCGTISWDNDSVWTKSSAVPKKVHMVAMNHLDVGYNGIPGVGLVNNILNMYFELYFPRAVVLANALRARNGTERFIYTTHPWLVDLYVNCPANMTLSGVPLSCPAQPDVDAFKAAMAAGDIVMHASPFNIQVRGEGRGASEAVRVPGSRARLWARLVIYQPAMRSRLYLTRMPAVWRCVEPDHAGRHICAAQARGGTAGADAFQGGIPA